MSTSEVIKEAWSAVDEAGLPDDVKETAFREVLRSMLSGSEPVGKPRFNARGSNTGGGSGNTGGGQTGDGDAVDVDEAEVFAKVEHETGVSVEQLERLVSIEEDGTVKFVVPGRDLGNGMAAGTRVVAQVLTVIESCGLGKSGTEYETIRKECERLRVYDAKNFSSKHLKTGLPGYVTKGQDSTRRLEVKSAGIQSFPVLVEKLVGA